MDVLEREERIMALRLIELFLPGERAGELEEMLADYPVADVRRHETTEGQQLARILVPGEATEPVLDALEERFGMLDAFRALLISVEATLPRLETEDEEENGKAQAEPEEVDRISREELYTDIADTTRPTRVYVLMVVLSALVAALGMLRNDVAVIIGAMVIAPLLGPNVALSLATTLGDGPLARRALKSNGLGLVLALAVALTLGATLGVDPETPELVSRSTVSLTDVGLALASGSAGALAFTSGVAAAVVGVMVAVALLPPLVAAGLLAASGHMEMAVGAGLLVATNVICVNLAGVTTFLAQGIRPLSWWEADRARKATRWAAALWIGLLLLLVSLIVLSGRS